MRGRIDPTDQKYGHLTAVRFVRDEYTTGNQLRPVWSFRCDCGTMVDARLYSVRSGGKRSCGCRSHENRATHGASVGKKLTPEYRAWRCMLTRSKNERIKNADRYSLRGITVAPEWDSGGDGQGFVRFLDHVGPKPSSKHSLDRIDNDRGYEPGNVRWATQSDQVNNRSATFMIECDGDRRSLADWSHFTGLPSKVIYDRITKLGWETHRALTAPMKPDRRRSVT